MQFVCMSNETSDIDHALEEGVSVVGHIKLTQIEFVEKSIIEHAFEQGWVQPVKDIKRNGIKVAIIGSGPAGLACADQLNKLGYSVDLYERSDRIGGLLRYGIPDFKLEKDIIT